MTIRNGVLAGVVCLAGIPAAMAGTIDASVTPLAGTVSIGGWDTDFDFTTSNSVIDQGGGTFGYMGSFSGSNWDFGWDVTANADPFIAGDLTFTNTTLSNQTFNVVLSLPILQEAGLVNETGELALTLSDSGGNGSADLTLNQWHGLINPLAPPPDLDMALLIGSSFNCSGGSGCATALFPPATASQQHGPADHGGNPVDSIGIHLNFDLSAGDTATFNTRYELTAVPVPAAVWLFASGLAGLVGVARGQTRHLR